MKRFLVVYLLIFVAGCVTPAPADRGDAFRRQADAAMQIENSDKRAYVLAHSLRNCANEVEAIDHYYAERENAIRGNYDDTVDALVQKVEKLSQRNEELSNKAVDEAGATTDLAKWSMISAIGVGFLVVIGLAIYAYIKRGVPGL